MSCDEIPEFNELERVKIPKEVANKECVEDEGTIVWSLSGADFITVECQLNGNLLDNIDTKLIDISIYNIKKIL